MSYVHLVHIKHTSQPDTLPVYFVSFLKAKTTASNNNQIICWNLYATLTLKSVFKGVIYCAIGSFIFVQQADSIRMGRLDVVNRFDCIYTNVYKIACNVSTLTLFRCVNGDGIVWRMHFQRNQQISHNLLMAISSLTIHALLIGAIVIAISLRCECDYVNRMTCFYLSALLLWFLQRREPGIFV